MASSTTKFSYQRLRNDGDFEEGEEDRAVGRRRSSWSSRIKRLGGKKRSRIVIPGLRRFLKKKGRVISAVRVSWRRVLKRLKESRPHMGDLFAGNYLFMQVSPTPFKCVDKYSFMAHNLHGLPPSYTLGRIA